MQMRARWDIFCQVVDNFGDIGVCWRLARQLACEHPLQIRLWVDDLTRFAKLAPELDPTSACQFLSGVEIRKWALPFATVDPAAVVIEAFACNLPDSYIAAMAAQAVKPRWINIEYLSAESWVAEHHGLPSPHPRLPLTKYFFFPGFTVDSGGLIREAELRAARDVFQNDLSAQAAWWSTWDITPQADSLTLSLFAYPNAPIAPLLAAWTTSLTPIVCVVPLTPLSDKLASILGGAPLLPGTRVRRGNLTLIGLPFLSQTQYDRLLWACDLNFVRGEDSFVRAQWANKPFIWNIYPQADAAHPKKLEAFLQLYCDSAPETHALPALWRTWNNLGGDPATAWFAFAAALPRLKRHAQCWSRRLASQADLATQLVNFSQKPL